MPTNQPSMSFQFLRNLTEKFSWIDKRTGIRTTGFNPPKSATDIKRVPYHIKYVTAAGRMEEGNCITLKVNTRLKQRTVRFVADEKAKDPNIKGSGSIRVVRDYLVIEVDGIRILTH